MRKTNEFTFQKSPVVFSKYTVRRSECINSNPYYVTDLFPYPLKTCFFREYRERPRASEAFKELK